MFDADLARFYGVTTFNLNKAVARNRDRFPKDFAFKLTLEETQALIFQTGISRPDGPKALMFQPGTSKPGRGGTRKPATVFTEQGVARLAGVLRSTRAVAVSVAIVRAFVQLRELLAGHRQLAAKLAELEAKLEGHDAAIANLFEAIRQLLGPPDPVPRLEIGFHTRLLPEPKKEIRQDLVETVVIDADLAVIYGVATRTLNQAVKRNATRFPADFVFQVSAGEKQWVITNCDHLAHLKFSKSLPWAYTEHGAIMAAMLLNSVAAVSMSVYIVRAFLRMRAELASGADILKRLAAIDRKLLVHDVVLRDIYRKLQPPRLLRRLAALRSKRRTAQVVAIFHHA